MRISFPAPIIGEDASRNGVTIDHLVIYPSNMIVLNNKDGSNKVLRLAGLSAAAKKALNDFAAALAADIIDEYVNGGVTARAGVSP